MSNKEWDKAGVIQRVLDRRLSQVEAARILGISTRQIRRLCRRVDEHGIGSLSHGLRGRPSNRRSKAGDRARILAVVRERYADFGPTLAQEKLAELHELHVSVETLRQWMMAEGLWKDRRRREKRPQRPRRRRPCRGQLVQIDGSDHEWFEDRGPRCTLLVYIDDATSELMELRFEEVESTFGYFAATRSYLERHGKPVALYSDKAAVFRVARRDAAGGAGETQFGRALSALNIDILCANTPAAKGRVERANNTLQDRLVKEMRLAGISDIDSANAWVETYREDHNRRFARAPASEHDAHRPLLPTDDLDRIFTWQVKRKVTQSLTLRYNRVLYVLDDTPDTRRARGHRVDVLEEDNGTVTLWHNGRNLPAKAWPKDGRSHQADVVPNKRLGAALAWAEAHQAAREEANTRRKTKREQQLLADGTRRRPGKSRLLPKAG